LFTNEFWFNKTVTTLLDETAQVDDVVISIEYDSGYVLFEQEGNTIIMPPHMFKEMNEALHSTEGAYRLIER